jgi:hypothetical protein
MLRRRRTVAVQRKKPGRDERWHRREVERWRREVSVARSGGGEFEVKKQRKKKEWGKKRELPPLPYLYRGAVVVGTMVVLHYPNRFCGGSPHGSVSWGGSSGNRATRPIMAMMTSSNHTVNHHLM